MKKVATLALLCLTLVGCSQEEKPASLKILRLNIAGEPISLDPRLGGERRSQVVTNMLFEGLTRMTAEGPAELAMADRVEISSDKRTYTFHLREAYWSTGQPVTAYDFEQSWKRNLSPNFDSLHSYLLFNIRNAEKVRLGELPDRELGVTVVNPQTLVVELETPAPYFLDLLALPILAPVPVFLDRENNNWSRSVDTFVCNGPFQLVEWKHEDEIRVVKNPCYWDGDNVKIDGISLSIVDDAHSVLSLFEQGELDWVGEPLSELPLDAVEVLAASGQLETTPVNATYYYYFNTELPLFSSQKVRRAFALAIDRAALVEGVLHGNAGVAGSILPTRLTLHSGPLVEATNPELAQKLFEEGLAELGLTRDELDPIILSYAQVEGEKATAQAVQQQWQETFGVKVNMEPYEWKTYFARMNKRQFQVAHLTWYSWKRDPIYNLESVKHVSDQFNWPGWENAEYTALLDASDLEPDEQKRKQLLRQAEAIVMEEMPIAPVYMPRFKHMSGPGVEGVAISDMGLVDFKHVEMPA